MPRVHHVKKARKDNPAVKKGEPYYWWKFRFGGKHYSKTPPKQSQLTQSAFLSSLYDLQDDISAIDLEGFIEMNGDFSDLTDQIQMMQDECQDSLDNMPDSLQYSPTGELLRERIDAMEGWIADIDGLSVPDEDDKPEQWDGAFDDFKSIEPCI